MEVIARVGVIDHSPITPARRCQSCPLLVELSIPDLQGAWARAPRRFRGGGGGGGGGRAAHLQSAQGLLPFHTAAGTALCGSLSPGCPKSLGASGVIGSSLRISGKGLSWHTRAIKGGPRARTPKCLIARCGIWLMLWLLA